MGEHTIEELVKVNVRAPIELTRYLLPGMLMASAYRALAQRFG